MDQALGRRLMARRKLSRSGPTTPAAVPATFRLGRASGCLTSANARWRRPRVWPWARGYVPGKSTPHQFWLLQSTLPFRSETERRDFEVGALAVCASAGGTAKGPQEDPEQRHARTNSGSLAPAIQACAALELWGRLKAYLLNLTDAGCCRPVQGADREGIAVHTVHVPSCKDRARNCHVDPISHVLEIVDSQSDVEDLRGASNSDVNISSRGLGHVQS